MFDLIRSHSLHQRGSNIVLTIWFNLRLVLQFLIKLPIHWRVTAHALAHSSLSCINDVHIQDSVVLSKADSEKINLSHQEPPSSSFTLLVTPSSLPLYNSSQGPSGWVRQQWRVMSGLTQVSSLGCNLHLFYPSFVVSAGPEPGKQIATVLVLRSGFASVVEHGKRTRERGPGCGRKAFGSSRAGMLWLVQCHSIPSPSYRQH